MTKTIECKCGYIATFETHIFKCPDCGREYRNTYGSKGGNIIQSGLPEKKEEVRNEKIKKTIYKRML